MKALALLDSSQFTTPGEFRVKAVTNALYSMGFDVDFYTSISVGQSPTVSDLDALIVAGGYSCLVVTNYTGSSRGYYDQYMNGTMSVPVFVCGVVTNLGLNGVTTTYYDNAAVFAQAEIVKTGGIIYTNTRRHQLSNETAPAQTVALVRGTGAESPAVTAWKWTPDGINWVYYTNSVGIHNLLHMLVQAAIDDGVLPKPAKPAPVIVNIDHINDGGDAPHDGGFQEQPGRLALIGDILRQTNGVCYANLEKAWINNDNGNLGGGTTSGDLLKNLQEYSDVFRYIASHDHNQFYTAGNGANDANDNQTAKTLIDASYQTTKSSIESLGLTVNEDFAHMAGNRFGTNFLELAQDAVDYTCDPNNAVPKQGYGFKVVRVSISPTANESYPFIGGIPSTTSVPPTHWLKSPLYFRGMLFINNADGDTANGGVNSLSLDYTAFSFITRQLNCGLITYHHGTDFEDASVRTTGLSTDGNAMTRGLLTWQTGRNYALACPDTVKFGADILHYI